MERADRRVGVFVSTSPCMADDNLVEFRDVTFAYPGARGERVILDRVSLQVPRGKVTALMGGTPRH